MAHFSDLLYTYLGRVSFHSFIQKIFTDTDYMLGFVLGYRRKQIRHICMSSWNL